MKLNKQLLLCLLLAVLCVASPTTVWGKIAEYHWAKDLLNAWEDQGLLPVGPDDTIIPDKKITRGEFIGIINHAFNFQDRNDQLFVDVPAHSWYREDAAIAAAAGYITGYKNAQGAFELRADKPISRQEAAVILSRVFSLHGGDSQIIQAFTDWKKIGSFATENIAYLVDAGYISGYSDQTFKPLNKVTLAEAVKMVSNIAGEIISDKGSYNGLFDGNVLVNTDHVVLSNAVVNGDLYVTQGIGDGQLRLDQVTVKGNTYLVGANLNNLHLQYANLQGPIISVQGINEPVSSAVAAELTSFSINGYHAKMTDGTNNLTILVDKNADMSKLKVKFTTSKASTLWLGNTELKNAGTYTFGDAEELVLKSADNKQNNYPVSIFKVDRIVNTGLPTLVINTAERAPVVDKVNKIKASMALLDGRLTQYGEGLYQGTLTIKGRGNSSWEADKKAYAVSTTSDAQLLDLQSEDDWVLIPNHSDKTLMRNFLAYSLGASLNLGYTPRVRFVEFYLNGEYLGNYLLGEKIKISSKRLNINKMKETDNSGAAVTGGYLIEKDWIERLDDDEIYFQTKRVNAGDVFNIKGPKPSKLTTEQINYITDYFQQAEDALYSDNFKDPVTGYQQYIDVDSFIDWYIVNELFKNVDSRFGTSVYLYKEMNGKIHFGPLWDFDLGAGNLDYTGAVDPDGFFLDSGLWIPRLLEDPAIRQRLKDRWAEIKDHQIEGLFTMISDTEKLLKASATENFNRWSILGKEVWPRVEGFETRTTYQSEVDFLVNWLKQRVEWLNKNIPLM